MRATGLGCPSRRMGARRATTRRAAEGLGQFSLSLARCGTGCGHVRASRAANGSGRWDCAQAPTPSPRRGSNSLEFLSHPGRLGARGDPSLQTGTLSSRPTPIRPPLPLPSPHPLRHYPPPSLPGPFFFSSLPAFPLRPACVVLCPCLPPHCLPLTTAVNSPRSRLRLISPPSSDDRSALVILLHLFIPALASALISPAHDNGDCPHGERPRPHQAHRLYGHVGVL